MKNLLLTLLALSLTGCALFNGEKLKKSKPDETVVNIPLQVPGVMLSGNDQGRIRTSENIKSYYIGRHIDPGNPNLLHPAGVVLEVVDKPRWIMTPRGVDVPSGVPTRLAENKCSQSLVSEFRQDMETLKFSAKALDKSRKKLDECRKAMVKTVNELNLALDRVEKTSLENKEIKQQIENLNRKMADLENKNLFYQDIEKGKEK